jgi:imidazolonepropionase-like amidohydrolase
MLLSLLPILRPDHNRGAQLFLSAVLLSSTGLAQAQPAAARPDTTTYVALGPEKPMGLSKLWYSDPKTLHSTSWINDRGRGYNMQSTVTTGAGGRIVGVKVTGVDYFKKPIEETFSFDGKVARWKNSAEAGEQAVGQSLPYYKPAYAEDGDFFLQNLLAAPGHRLPLLPSGEASVRQLLETTVQAGGQQKRVRLYAVSGLGYTPSNSWYDTEGHFFFAGSTWSATVLKGWEPVRARLLRLQDSVATLETKARLQGLVRTPTKPLVFKNVNVFDAPSGKVLPGQTVVVEGKRIKAVGPTGKVAVPAGAEIIDGKGKTLLPGLWDMHVHIFPRDGVFHLASGVTTVRDMANDATAMQTLRADFDANRNIGPRLLTAGIIDGPGPFQGPTKVLASTEAEVHAAIDNYARLGYPQIKLYSSLSPKLVPDAIQYAHQKGLRVSGHIPSFMSAEQSIRAGLDEMQHINMVFLNFIAADTMDTRSTKRFTEVAKQAADLDLKSARVQAFVQLMKEKNVVLDPTLGVFETMFLSRAGQTAPGMAAVANRLPPQIQRGYKVGGLPVPAGQDAQYRKSFQACLNLTKQLHDAGIVMVAGTDGQAGFMLHRELELYVQAGIPAPQALQMATINGARVMKQDQDLGSIAPGKLADLLLVDGNPAARISDIRRGVLVVKDGNVYDPAALFRSVSVQPTAL